MSNLRYRLKKLEEAVPKHRTVYGLAIPQEGETREQAIARVRAAKPCRKVYVVDFVDPPECTQRMADKVAKVASSAVGHHAKAAYSDLIEATEAARVPNH